MRLIHTSTRGQHIRCGSGQLEPVTVWSLARIREVQHWGARIDGGVMDLTNDAGANHTNLAGWAYGYTPVSNFTSPYISTLSSNPGVVT